MSMQAQSRCQQTGLNDTYHLKSLDKLIRWVKGSDFSQSK